MRRLFWKLRLAMKLCWRYVGRSWGLVEFCQVCGREQPLVWSAPDALWLELSADKWEVLCPECFDRLASKRRLRLRWTCKERGWAHWQ